MATALLADSAIDFDASSRLVQPLVAAFVFGMIHAHATTNKLTPPDAHALALLVFEDTLHYTPEAALAVMLAALHQRDALAPAANSGMAAEAGI